MCLAPMVFCCLPLLIRLSLFLPPGVGLRVLEQQGASESLLEKLPPAKRYERGMFATGEEEAKQTPQADTSAGAKEGSPATNHDAPEWSACNAHTLRSTWLDRSIADLLLGLAATATYLPTSLPPCRLLPPAPSACRITRRASWCANCLAQVRTIFTMRAS